MSAPETGHAERLDCGVAVTDLLAQVADGAPPADPDHQRACRHCQATLAELWSVWTAVHRLAGEQVTVPPAFEANVRRRIGEPTPAGPAAPSTIPTPRPRTWVPLRAKGAGTTRVGDTVLARVARLAAHSVDGISTGPVSRANPTVTVADGRVVVAVDLGAPYGEDVVALADAVRMAIVVQLLALAGLDDVQVDVTVTALTE